jgi:hypothetical protein
LNPANEREADAAGAEVERFAVSNANGPLERAAPPRTIARRNQRVFATIKAAHTAHGSGENQLRRPHQKRGNFSQIVNDPRF